MNLPVAFHYYLLFFFESSPRLEFFHGPFQMQSVHLGKDLVLFYVLLLPGRISEQSFGAGNEDNSMFLSNTPTLKAHWRWGDCSLCLLCKLHPAWNLYFLVWGKGGLGPQYFQWPYKSKLGIRRKLPPLGCTLPKLILSYRYWGAGWNIPISCHSQEDSFRTRSWGKGSLVLLTSPIWCNYCLSWGVGREAVDFSSHTTESHSS